jgi:hypothetical protein
LPRLADSPCGSWCQPAKNDAAPFFRDEHFPCASLPQADGSTFRNIQIAHTGAIPLPVGAVCGILEPAARFRSLTEALDTTTAQGLLVFHMFGALAENSSAA